MHGHFDVAIVGGGMVGLSLACALGQTGLTVAVVDREAPSGQVAPTFDGRASALADATLRLFEGAGIWRHVADSTPIAEIRVSDGDSLLFLHYDHRLLGDRPLGRMVENRHIRLALQARLAELPNVDLIAPMTLASHVRDLNGVALTLADGRTLRARLLVAADGRQSALRQAAGIRTTGWDYRQNGIVATIRHEVPHANIAHERFLPPGPFAILPLSDNRASLVWTERRDDAARFMAMEKADFDAAIAARVGGFLGAIESVGPRFSWQLSLHIAERYTDTRLALVGDAAHGIHPIAGQGLNLGLRDVAALAEVIVDGARLGLDPGDAEGLARYQSWRRFDALTMAGVTDVLNRLFANDIAPVRLARDLGLAAVDRLIPLKKLLMRHAMGSVGNLPRLLRGEAL
jgi:2-octaprenyl-6-methoxyphenol hydroxylase